MKFIGRRNDYFTDEDLSLSLAPHPADCDFEKDICKWKSAYFADMQWTRRKGSTPSWQTGPSKDHTTDSSLGKKHNILMKTMIIIIIIIITITIAITAIMIIITITIATTIMINYDNVNNHDDYDNYEDNDDD